MSQSDILKLLVNTTAIFLSDKEKNGERSLVKSALTGLEQNKPNYKRIEWLNMNHSEVK